MGWIMKETSPQKNRRDLFRIMTFSTALGFGAMLGLLFSITEIRHEWPLVKAQNFLAEPFATRWIGQGAENDFTAELLHTLKDLLHVAPVFNGLLECLILWLR